MPEPIDPDLLAVGTLLRVLAKRVAALDGTSLASIRAECIDGVGRLDIPFASSVEEMATRAEAVGVLASLLRDPAPDADR